MLCGHHALTLAVDDMIEVMDQIDESYPLRMFLPSSAACMVFDSQTCFTNPDRQMQKKQCSLNHESSC